MVNENAIMTGAELKEALGPEKWDEFLGYVAEGIAARIVEKQIKA
ncbi:hypothetical protein [Methanoregula sp.]|nr:hypothetical protein [Methanoregula sp.]